MPNVPVVITAPATVLGPPLLVVAGLAAFAVGFVVSLLVPDKPSRGGD